MKIQGAKKIHYDSGPNLTPMVDIVLVLLIIMMVSATYIVSQSLKVELPKTASSDDTRPSDCMPGRIGFDIAKHGLDHRFQERMLRCADDVEVLELAVRHVVCDALDIGLRQAVKAYLRALGHKS